MGDYGPDFFDAVPWRRNRRGWAQIQLEEGAARIRVYNLHGVVSEYEQTVAQGIQAQARDPLVPSRKPLHEHEV
eukprot:CAMPEP_0118990672 /NCGR_PEP_ID=MMETSP1173-20130426/50343_1 /TAXON_ID=1034831 /ORGANISM="Rhizochromulina marina cf, Strain CCMP1243" /LENGTH=73 /DNA_ID=CAMNT_0006941737 /DNA_START=96 /DNA_END=314 /DNA_ORIENTATION=-